MPDYPVYFYNCLPECEKGKLHLSETASEFMEYIQKTFGDRPAINNGGEVITYNQLCENVARRRAYINSLGLADGDKIAVFERNSKDAIELFLAILTSGKVVSMFPAQLAGMQLLGSIRKFDVKAVFVREEFMGVAQAAGVPAEMIHPSSAIADTPAPANPAIKKEDPAAIYFTGGTTGVPKGALLSQMNLMRGTYNGSFQPGGTISKEHRYICFLPFSHVFGSIRGLLSCFNTGAQVWPCEDMKAGIGSIPRVRPTCLVLVPGLVEILLGMAKMYGPQFLGSELKMIISGAANVPPRLISAMKQIGIDLLEGYGLTESANFTAGNYDVDTVPESVGRIYDPQQTKVVDGELWLKGDNIFMGYYNDPKQTADAFSEDGWFKTGDLVKFDENGYLYIVGRIKNLIILDNGENVSPESIEEPFYKLPFIKDCLVSEVKVDDRSVIGIQILPNMPFLEGNSPEEIHAMMEKAVEDINATLPTQWQVRQMTVRTEDFKRTGSLKIARNQN